ncbi:MAG: hypothetical protein NTU60_07620 [Candidatus Aminicenantes bacterium]|nr:hypothetical protein [Candidatus Aminicenantes bacterium]
MRLLRISMSAAVLVFGWSMTAGFGASKPLSRQIELGLWGGLSPIRIVGTTTVQDSWSSFLLNTVTERTVIQSKAKMPPAAGGYFSIFLSPHLGVQVLAGYGQADLTTGAAFDFAWAWADGTGASKNMTWSGTGRLTRVPVCLNMVFREESGPFTLEVSGGFAYYWNTLREGSMFGYGVTSISPVYQPPDWVMAQTVDALPVRLAIPSTSWTAAGADIGGSLNVRLAGPVGLKAEARYYYCPPKRFSWKPAFGSYDGMFGDAIKGELFTADDAAYLAGIGQMLDQKMDLSFVQFSLGVTFFFGRGLRH